MMDNVLGQITAHLKGLLPILLGCYGTQAREGPFSVVSRLKTKSCVSSLGGSTHCMLAILLSRVPKSPTEM